METYYVYVARMREGLNVYVAGADLDLKAANNLARRHLKSSLNYFMALPSI